MVGTMNLNPAGRNVSERDVLLSQRRGLIRTTSLLIALCVVVITALVAVMFSEDRKAWNDESQVTQTQGAVAEEVRSSRGSCKGPDFDTRIEWIQDGETRTAWTGTCRSGPDVGDTVDVWVRDDGEITLTEPSTTVVFTVVGIMFFGGLGILVIFVLRSNLRRLNRRVAGIDHEV